MSSIRVMLSCAFYVGLIGTVRRVNQAAKLVFGLFVVDALLQLLARAVGLTGLGTVTKPLLLPLLMVFVLVAVGWSAHSSIKWLVIGQGFSFLGDVALMLSGDLWFALGMLMFAGTHVCYLVGFFQLGAREALRERRWVLFVYPAFWLVANAVLWPGLGMFRIPILIYSALLVTMALVSMSLGTAIGIGGTLFMLSDLMIGATVAFGDFAGADFWIMLTYVVGQALIAWFWVKRVQVTSPDQQRVQQT